MIQTFDDAILVTGNELPWEARYELEQTFGPATFDYDGEPLCSAPICRIDDLDESLALADDVRSSRKGQAAIVHTTGQLPFGAGVRFAHTSHFSDHAVRVVTDIRIPKGTVLKTKLEVDSLKFPGNYREWRQLREDGELSDWTALESEPVTWTQHPLALVLRRDDGVELEIGVGVDVWRWREGLLEAGNRGQYCLERGPDGIHFRRVVTRVDEEHSPRPRSYRFSWYLAWGPATGITPPSGAALDWRPQGGLEPAAIASAAADCVTLDLRACPVPGKLCHTPGGGPCFSASGLRKRVRKAIRQLQNTLPADTGVVLAGLIPAPCLTGRHVDRTGEFAHFDLTGILELALWIRQRLGSERRLHNEPTLDLPSLRRLFARADHDRNAVEYEYDPGREV